MNHPTQEEWMACLYGETDPRVKASAEAHLERCPECREQVAVWRSAMSLLDEDRATLVPPRRAGFLGGWGIARPLLAASIVLVAGFLAGRLAGPSRAEMREELTVAQARMESEIRARYESDLRGVAVSTVTATAAENRRWLDETIAHWAAARSEDQELVRSTLRRIEDRQQADGAAVRAGLLGLARYTGSGFEQTQSRFNEISQTKVSQPAPSPMQRPVNSPLQ